MSWKLKYSDILNKNLNVNPRKSPGLYTDFINEYFKQLGCDYQIECFLGMTVSHEIHCNDCGTKWDGTIKPVLQQRAACPGCHNVTKAYEWLETSHLQSVDFLKPWTYNRTKLVEFICIDCCRIISKIPDQITANDICGCSKMGYPQWLSENRTDVTLSGDYLNMITPVEHRCCNCSHSWAAKPTKIKIQGTGCPKCAGRDHDVLYSWMDDSCNWKIGVTSSRLKDWRIRECARSRRTSVSHLRMVTVSDAKQHESFLLNRFNMLPYTIGDGYTEFRTLSTHEVAFLTEYMKEISCT